MNVGHICQRDVDLAQTKESVQAAAQRMEARNVGSLLVLDAEQRPIGILTDRDLALKVVGHGKDVYATTVDEVMSVNPVRVTHRVSIDDALSMMSRKSVRRLPVVDDEGRLLGVLSFDDVILAMTEQFATARRLLQKESPRAVAKEL